MVIIDLPTGTDWHDSNWVYRWLATDVAEMFPDDADMNLKMKIGRLYGHLDLNAIEIAMASEIVAAMRMVAQSIVNGEPRTMTPERAADTAGQAGSVDACVLPPSVEPPHVMKEEACPWTRA